MSTLVRPIRAVAAAMAAVALLGALPATLVAQKGAQVRIGSSQPPAQASVPIGRAAAPRHPPRYPPGYGYGNPYGYGYGRGYGYAPQVVIVIVPVPVYLYGVSYYTPYDNGQMMMQYGNGAQQLLGACPAAVSYTGQQWVMNAPAQLPAEQAQSLTTDMPALAQSIAPGLPLPCYTVAAGRYFVVTR